MREKNPRFYYEAEAGPTWISEQRFRVRGVANRRPIIMRRLRQTQNQTLAPEIDPQILLFGRLLSRFLKVFHDPGNRYYEEPEKLL